MAYLNSDDVLAPGALDFVARYFAAHPEVDAIYSHRIFIDENNLVTRYWILPPHHTWMMQRWDYIPQETCFWRRRIYDKVGGIDPSFRVRARLRSVRAIHATGADGTRGLLPGRVPRALVIENRFFRRALTRKSIASRWNAASGWRIGNGFRNWPNLSCSMSGAADFRAREEIAGRFAGSRLRLQSGLGRAP